MRPGADVLGRRSRKDLDAVGLASTAGLAHNTPTSFRMASEDEAFGPGSDSTFGVRSLQETIDEASSPIQTEDDDEEQNDEIGDGHEGRRRSTLRPKPKVRTRDSSRASVEQAPVNTGNSSPYNPSQADHLAPSMSQSFASLSSHAPLSSMPSSPKSFSNRSSRPSDEDSMDEGGSQALASSEDDDVEPQSQSSMQDSAPQLIMPSIKMPSRRPFTERGKGLGRLKVLVAGDSGMRTGIPEGSPNYDAYTMLQVLARRLSSSQSCRPAKISCTWIRYPQISLPSTISPLENPKASQTAPMSGLQIRSRRCTQAPSLIQHGGRISKKAKSYAVEKVWATLCLSEIFALLILQATATAFRGWRAWSRPCSMLRRNSASHLQTSLEAKAIS